MIAASLFQNLAELRDHAVRLTDRHTLLVACEALAEAARTGGESRQIVASSQLITLFQVDPLFGEGAPLGAQIWASGPASDARPALSGVTFRAIPATWPLADEWFVVVNSPDLAAAVVAQPAAPEHAGPTGSFNTFFTFEQPVINKITLLLHRLLQLNLTLPAHCEYQARQLYQSHILRRVLANCTPTRPQPS
jgi:hypothetical protein